MDAIDVGREDLAAWVAAQPKNFFSEDPLIPALLTRLLASEDRAAMLRRLEDFGALCAGPMDEAATVNNRNENLPRLERYDRIGRRTEGVEHHPSYHDVGRMIYESGMMSEYGRPGGFLRSLAFFLLSSHCGEAGHNCPVACTAGIIKSLQGLGSEDLRATYLPRLLSPRYAERFDGAQFLTEVQGGSDVGANATRAEPAVDGTWRVFGEKWFCSNADADLFLMTARWSEERDGTSGLGLFLVPRRLSDGSTNAFHIRRLKDKLGTRSMPSGEIDFAGAVAWALGEPSEGFKNMMRFVINVSRIYNGVAVTGTARRAWHVARTYAAHRRAFGRPIGEYALVQDNLADLEAFSAETLLGSFLLVPMLDDAEAGALSADEQAFLRMGTNLHKRRSAMTATACVLQGIEVLGGNGAIESFSILPRLLRDAIVCENWEGTHHTLTAQVLRDMARYRLHEPFLRVLEQRLGCLSCPATAAERALLASSVRHAHDALDGLREDAGTHDAPLRLKPWMDTLAWQLAGLAFLEQAEHTQGQPAGQALLPVLRHYFQRRFPTA